jgi:LmbE family N-acetylglucosaminyl deacetylase
MSRLAGENAARGRGDAPARSKRVLVVLAHQDDECAVSTRIEWERERGHAVTCVFLTDGAARGVDPALRDAESRRVLLGLGVPESEQIFLGSARRFPDGRLVCHLEPCLEALEEALAGRRFDRVYCQAYEGGHPDHDASHLIALALARPRGLLGRTWQFPVYNGYRRPWKLFRVQAPLPREALRRGDRCLPASVALRHCLLWTHYRSQRRTWLGLAPEQIVRRGLLRREYLTQVRPQALRERPHRGRLLYEALMGFSYDDFRAAAEPFLARHLA